MKREDCWMTFSQALARYLESCREIEHFGPGRNQEQAIKNRTEAEEHMDALTALPDPDAVPGRAFPKIEINPKPTAKSPFDHDFIEAPGHDVIGYCMVCQGAKGSLPTLCPRRPMTRGESDAVYRGELNFASGPMTGAQWWRKA